MCQSFWKVRIVLWMYSEIIIRCLYSLNAWLCPSHFSCICLCLRHCQTSSKRSLQQCNASKLQNEEAKQGIILLNKIYSGIFCINISIQYKRKTSENLGGNAEIVNIWMKSASRHLDANALLQESRFSTKRASFSETFSIKVHSKCQGLTEYHQRYSPNPKLLIERICLDRG